MQKKSVYKYASEAGLPAGIYLTMMSACILLSLKLPALPLLLIPLSLGFPVLIWVLLKNIVNLQPEYNKFSSLWLAGIYTVIFGCLICLFVSAFYLVCFEPNFVAQYVTNALAAVEASPVADQYGPSIRLMHEAIEAHILPSGLEFLTTMAWFTCFCGSIISLFIAMIMSRTYKKETRQSLS